MIMNNRENNQLNFLDLINLMSFCISLMNLNENITQNDKQEMMQELSKKTDLLLREIHQHLENQDKKIDMILEKISK